MLIKSIIPPPALPAFAASKAADKLAGVKNTGVTTVTDTKSSSVTVQTDSNASMLQDSTKKFGDIAKQTIEDSFSTKPTITISQGTKINILVQRDLIFPVDANGSVIAK